MVDRSLIIRSDASFIHLLKQINKSEGMAIYVVDDYEKLIGVVTDGDIRRGFINGLSEHDRIEKFMFTDFHYLTDKEIDIEKLINLRNSKLRSVPILSDTNKIIDIIDFSKQKSLLPIDAIIMAGGKGTRLLPLTNDKPKPLIKINGKEIISYNIDRLNYFGIKNQNITTNYLSEKIFEFCENYHDPNIKFNVIKEEEYLGTAGSISLVKNFFNDTVLLMNSDLLTNIDYEDFYLSFKRNQADVMVASYPYKVTVPYGVFNVENHRINSINEKPTFSYFSNAGIYLIKKEILKQILEFISYVYDQQTQTVQQPEQKSDDAFGVWKPK